MPGAANHPSLTNPDYTTVIVSWFDGGLRFFKAPPAEGGTVILDIYYAAYLLIFVCTFIMLKRWQKRGEFKVRPYQVHDLSLMGIVGVLLGAKAAYIIFYNWEYYAKHPADILLNWSGMASHGALGGLAVAIAIWCWRSKTRFLHVADTVAVPAMFAPLFVRIANFAIGELYGREAPVDFPLAMRFPMRDGEGRELYVDQAGNAYALIRLNEDRKPTDDMHLQLLDSRQKANLHSFEPFEVSRDIAIKRNPGSEGYEALPIGAAKRDDEGRIVSQIREAAHVSRMITTPSHPVQLYESLLGGVVLMVVLLILRKRVRLLGTVTAAGLIGYGAVRFCMELLRQPDPQRGFVLLGLTMGQILSVVGLIGGGVAILIYQRYKPTLVASIPMPTDKQKSPSSTAANTPDKPQGQQ